MTARSAAPDPGWDVLARVAAGEGDAFARLVDTHQERLLRLCERLLGDVEEARDAAQEVFLKAYRKAGEVAPRGRSTPGSTASPSTTASTSCGGASWSASCAGSAAEGPEGDGPRPSTVPKAPPTRPRRSKPGGAGRPPGGRSTGSARTSGRCWCSPASRACLPADRRNFGITEERSRAACSGPCAASRRRRNRRARGSRREEVMKRTMRAIEPELMRSSTASCRRNGPRAARPVSPASRSSQRFWHAGSGPGAASKPAAARRRAAWLRPGARRRGRAAKGARGATSPGPPPHAGARAGAALALAAGLTSAPAPASAPRAPRPPGAPAGPPPPLPSRATPAAPARRDRGAPGTRRWAQPRRERSGDDLDDQAGEPL